MSTSTIAINGLNSGIGATANPSDHPDAQRAVGDNAIAKVMADMNFLQDRMDQIKSHRIPNQAVLRTYSDMLTRRQMALNMLLAQGLRPQ